MCEITHRVAVLIYFLSLSLLKNDDTESRMCVRQHQLLQLAANNEGGSCTRVHYVLNKCQVNLCVSPVQSCSQYLCAFALLHKDDRLSPPCVCVCVAVY